MKTEIHPEYIQATITCSCGNSWETRATKPKLHVEVCSNCHPFFTGEQRIVDTEGQVDRFYKKLEARNQYQAAAAAREAARSSTDQPISVLELGERAETSLANAGMTTVTDILDRLQTSGEESFLTIDGFGRKSLIDLKKRLRAQGYLEEETTETA
jgi:large subunit ribosomal protein L31